MAHYGILSGTALSGSGEDIRSTHLYGKDDEKLGKIDDVIFDHSTADIRYIVVDTAGWLTSKKFIVPAESLQASAKHENDFEVNLTKKQVETFPPYNESDLESESKWSGYEGKYRAKWVNDPVMHRVETDRNVTPTTYQAAGNYESERSASVAHGGTGTVPRMPAVTSSNLHADMDATSALTERAVPPGTDTVVINNSAVGIGGRWDTFQSRLRERRKEAVAACRTCAGESGVKRGSESAETLRKAV
ncbi:MAG TPA: PRC-barrel domain-containing protein [Candidatus Sulfotelmatobacter sp.]|nr:PRC-barrel domain-containing protein [Candidatus Sulfotelmatobacter sp.]